MEWKNLVTISIKICESCERFRINKFKTVTVNNLDYLLYKYNLYVSINVYNLVGYNLDCR